MNYIWETFDKTLVYILFWVCDGLLAEDAQHTLGVFLTSLSESPGGVVIEGVFE